jgi:hypothetical protein
MPTKEYQVGGTTYEFPDSFSDEKVRDTLISKGVIKGMAPKSDKGTVGEPPGIRPGSSMGLLERAYTGVSRLTGTPESSAPRSVARGVDELVSGFGAGGATTGVGAYDAARKVPKVDKVLPPPSPYVRSLTEAHGLGKYTKPIEQAAEYLIPIPGLGEAKAGKGLLNLGGRMVDSALSAAPVAMAQSGGDLKKTEGAMAVAAASPVIGKVVEKISAPLKNAAQKIYESVLAGPGAKPSTVEKSASELISRGYTAMSSNSMATDVAKRLEKAGKSVEDAVEKAINDPGFKPGRSSGGVITMIPQGQIEMKPIVDAFKDKINERFMGSGKIPAGLEGEHEQYQQMLKDLKSRGEFAPIKDIWRLRQAWERRVKDFEKLGDLSGAKNAMGDASNAIRGEFAKWVPGLPQANAEYSFLKGVDTLLTAKKKANVGSIPEFLKTYLPAALAGAGGFVREGSTEAIEGAAAALMLTGLIRSTPGKTLSAVAMDRLGNLMSSGHTTDAVRYLGMLMNGSATVEPDSMGVDTSKVPMQPPSIRTQKPDQPPASR